MGVTHQHFREPWRAPALSLNLFPVGPSFPAPNSYSSAAALHAQPTALSALFGLIPSPGWQCFY